MNSARHVTGCDVTQETRVQNAVVDVASTIYECLRAGARHGPRCGGGRLGCTALADIARHVIDKRSNPQLLSCMASSHDVASNVCRALGGGRCRR